MQCYRNAGCEPVWLYEAALTRQLLPRMQRYKLALEQVAGTLKPKNLRALQHGVPLATHVINVTTR